jgi:hypothetical protein
MKFFNTNAYQTYITFAIMVIPFALLKSGCTAVGDSYDCSQSFIGPWGTAVLIGVLGLLKLLGLPIFQSGGLVRNLFSPKVPVSTSAAPGTVLPSDVMPPKP